MSTKIDVKIEIEKLGKNLENLGKAIVQDIQQQVKVFSKQVYNEALRLSAQRLHSSLTEYQNNLKYEKVGDNIYMIYLVDGSVANKYEEGWTPFDMKPGFLKSPKAHDSKDGGKYFDVPIQQHPQSKVPASPKVVDMRSAVAAVLKDKTVEKRIKEYNEKSTGLERFGNITRYTNTKDPRVEGLVRVTAPEGAKKSTKYFLFRRVSNNSDPSKWMHPGFKGADVFTDLEKFAQDGIKDLLTKILK